MSEFKAIIVDDVPDNIDTLVSALNKVFQKQNEILSQVPYYSSVDFLIYVKENCMGSVPNHFFFVIDLHFTIDEEYIKKYTPYFDRIEQDSQYHGFDLYKILRSIEKFKTTPIIILSSHLEKSINSIKKFSSLLANDKYLCYIERDISDYEAIATKIFGIIKKHAS